MPHDSDPPPQPEAPPHPEPPPRKDRLVQTRVARDLETRLKHEARRRRLSVSQLVRNVLEDTLDLVDGVLTNVDDIVADSVGLADRVRRDAARVVQTARGRQKQRRRESAPDRREANEAPGPDAGSHAAADEVDRFLDAVVAWNPVVLNRTTSCTRCHGAMQRGEDAYVGVGESADRIAAWLCPDCIEAL